jgi:hypothetical protein
MDELIQKAKARHPPWDEVSEQRVLARLEADLRPAHRSWSARRLSLAIGSAAAVAALVVAGTVLLLVRERPGDDVARDQQTQARSGAPTPTWGVSDLSLADNSRVLLSDGARVRVLAQSRDGIQLEQQSGRARYEVTPRPSRPFTVAVDGLTLRVMGTIFEVTVETGSVQVQVERGRVGIERDSGASVFLGPGEQIRLARRTASATQAAPEKRRRKRPGRGRSARSPRPTVAQLLAAVDAARDRGDLTRAARLLRQIIAVADPPRRVSAYFTLATIERERGRHDAAARAFQRCWEQAPDGPLAEDALASWALALARSGSGARAREIAQRYRERYPRGIHLPRLERDVMARSQDTPRPR